MKGVRPRCVCGCGRRSVNQHHVVYRQHLRGASPKDKRNLVPMAFECHGAHHNRSRVLPLAALPDAAFEFASELMGEAAYVYLRRRYAGDDPRLEALLSETLAD